jgi:hypothetical protein
MGQRETEARLNWSLGISALRALRDQPSIDEQMASMRQACAEAGVEPFEDPVTHG